MLLLIVVSVRSARACLWYCLIWVFLLLHVQAGGDPVGDHAGGEGAGGCGSCGPR